MYPQTMADKQKTLKGAEVPIPNHGDFLRTVRILDDCRAGSTLDAQSTRGIVYASSSSPGVSG